MIEYNALQQTLRAVRASLLKRDTLAGMGDASGSRSSGVEAKRNLKELKARIAVLEQGLESVTGLGQGEMARRQDLVVGIKEETGNVDRMAEAGVRVNATAAAASSTGRSGTPPVNESNRAALLGSAAAQKPTGRVFGAAASNSSTPQETAETRPLDEQGLVQLQKTRMSDQDAQLELIHGVLQKQRKMGQEIHQEIDEQNDLLDQLEGKVDKAGNKLGKAKRELNRLG